MERSTIYIEGDPAAIEALYERIVKMIGSDRWVNGLRTGVYDGSMKDDLENCGGRS